MKCDSSQSGTVMECPTCFQKITAPQAPATEDSKFIITGTKVGGRPIPMAVANAAAAPAHASEKSFPGPAVVFIVLFCVAAAVLFLFHGNIFKSAGGPASPGAAATNGMQKPAPPKPVVGPAFVVLAKGESVVMGDGAAEAAVTNMAQASFLATFKADLAAPLAFAAPLPLTTQSGNGGKVPGATGEIRYHESFPGGLVIGVTLTGLVPRHEYVLTLNGAVQHDGNSNLPDQLSRNNPQKFFDFSPAMTDTNGNYQATFGIRLPPGPYDVYFFVKDTSDWKIVLSHSFFQFMVE
jgi:hypothetical protein